MALTRAEIRKRYLDRHPEQREKRRLASKAWRETHRDHARAYMKKWHAEHPVEPGSRRDYLHDYYLEHRDRLLVYGSAYGREHRDEIRLRMRTYREANRHKTRQWSQRYYDKNRESVRARARKWYREHRERVRKHIQTRRARLAGVFVAPVPFEAIWIRDRGICQLCKKPASRETVHLDHIVPIALGGTHQPSNVQLAHKKCNLRKGLGRIPSQTRLDL